MSKACMVQFYADGNLLLTNWQPSSGKVGVSNSCLKMKMHSACITAERKLKPHFKDGKLPVTAWRKEMTVWNRNTRRGKRNFRPFMRRWKNSGRSNTR